MTPPLATDLYDGRTPTADDTSLVEILLSVAVWALSYQPQPNLVGKFEEFLGGFAQLLGDYSRKAQADILARLPLADSNHMLHEIPAPSPGEIKR